MTKRYHELAARMPRELRSAIDGLSGKDDRKYAIVVWLSENGGESFTELQQELGIEYNQQLTDALEDLQKAGLVKQEDKAEGDEYYVSYSLTKFCNRLLDALTEAIKPKYTINQENIHSIRDRDETTESSDLLEDISEDLQTDDDLIGDEAGEAPIETEPQTDAEEEAFAAPR